MLAFFLFSFDPFFIHEYDNSFIFSWKIFQEEILNI